MMETPTDDMKLSDVYTEIKGILSTYLDMPDDNKEVVALWILANVNKDAFLTFPELFINATKGSGKTRLLKLIHALIPRSAIATNLSDSVLFRLPTQQHLSALLLDEMERMGAKEKETLRELIVTCYKRGGKVYRTEEKKIKKVRTKVPVAYEIYMGVCMANIFGLDSVLEDRCITLNLERSNNPLVTKIPEFFEYDSRINRVWLWFGKNIVGMQPDTDDESKNILECVGSPSSDRSSVDNLSTKPSSSTSVDSAGNDGDGGTRRQNPRTGPDDRLSGPSEDNKSKYDTSAYARAIYSLFLPSTLKGSLVHTLSTLTTPTTTTTTTQLLHTLKRTTCQPF